MDDTTKRKLTLSPALKVTAALVTALWCGFVILDIVAYLRGGRSALTIYFKAAASCLCALVSFIAWRQGGSKKADLLIALA